MTTLWSAGAHSELLSRQYRPMGCLGGAGAT